MLHLAVRIMFCRAVFKPSTGSSIANRLDLAFFEMPDSTFATNTNAIIPSGLNI